MRLHRFFSKEKIGVQNFIEISDKDIIHHIKNVFRLKKGDSVILFDGSMNDYFCSIQNIEKNKLSLAVTETAKSKYAPQKQVWLCASIVKKDKFEWIVEKATELGVSFIVPINSERSEKKSLNMERINKIATEASEQSGRGDVPQILPISELKDLFDSSILPKNAKKIAFHTDSSLFDRKESESNPVVVFIGPEGGWSQGDMDIFRNNNVEVVCLGNQTLRSETAVVACLSLFLL